MSETTRPYISAKYLLAPRIARAKELGFDVNEPVYHGTTAGSFSNFIPKQRPREQLGFGIHVTVDPKFAQLYAHDPNIARRGKSPHVFVGFIRKGNVLHGDTIVRKGDPAFDLAMKLAGPKARFLTQNDETDTPCVYMQSAIDATTGQRAERLIKAAGYNVIRYQSRIGQRTAYGMAKGPASVSYVVLDPKDLRRTDAAFDPARSNSDDLSS